MALQLFNDLSPANTSIADSPTDVGFNINQVLVDVKDLSLLSRKALIGCYFLAATSPRNPEGAYDYDLGFFKWLINYSSSNNLAHLKRVLREAQKAAIEINLLDPNHPAKDKWASVPLMGIVTIQGGRIAFKLPNELVAGMSNPDGIMMYLSLRIQANFNSIYAQTLFAKVVPLKGSGCTPWMSLPDFSKWMNIDQYDWAKEYKYLNRDVIKVALEQINKHSDIFLTLETRTGAGTRRVEFIRFIIEPKSDASSWSSSVNGVLSEKEIYDVLTGEFGMPPKDLDKVMANRDKWSNAKLLEAIAYTRNRMKDTTLEFLRRPGNYFVNALENGYKLISPAQKKADVADLEFERNQRAEIQAKAESKKAKKMLSDVDKTMVAFETLDTETQNTLWAKYVRSPAKAIIKSVEKVENDGEPMERTALLSVERVRTGFAVKVQQHLDALASQK